MCKIRIINVAYAPAVLKIIRFKLVGRRGSSKTVSSMIGYTR